MNADEFAGKYLNKVVLYKGSYYKIPTDVKYWITAALFEYEDDGCSIFGIMSERWNPPTNIDWFTIKVSKEELVKLEEFEIVGEIDATWLKEAIEKRVAVQKSP